MLIDARDRADDDRYPRPFSYCNDESDTPSPLPNRACDAYRDVGEGVFPKPIRF
jgi:hypothetical protein